MSARRLQIASNRSATPDAKWIKAARYPRQYDHIPADRSTPEAVMPSHRYRIGDRSRRRLGPRSTLDEAETIGDVVEDFREAGFSNVLVIDGGSADGTREAGARAVQQSGSGKGQAVREAVSEHMRPSTSSCSTATARTAPKTRRHARPPPLRRGRPRHREPVYRHVHRRDDPPQPDRHRLINATFRTIHGDDFGDILSGYRAFTRDSFEEMHLTADGFGIETEMAVECAKRGTLSTVVTIAHPPAVGIEQEF
jgi:hypothetical protein